MVKPREIGIFIRDGGFIMLPVAIISLRVRKEVVKQD